MRMRSREGVLMTLCDMSGQVIPLGQVEAAAIWRNDYALRQTVWERYMMEQIREDKGADDATFLFRRPRLAMRENSIVTAHDYSYSTGPDNLEQALRLC